MASPYTEKLSGSDYLLPKMYWKKKKAHTRDSKGYSRITKSTTRIHQPALTSSSLLPPMQKWESHTFSSQFRFREYPSRICQLNYTERLQDCRHWLHKHAHKFPSHSSGKHEAYTTKRSRNVALV